MKLVVISPYGTYPEYNSGPPIVIYNLIKNWASNVEEIHLFTGSKEIDTISSIYKQYHNLHVYILPREWDRAKSSMDHAKYVSSFRMIFELASRVPAQSYYVIDKINSIKPELVFYNILPMDSSIAVPFILGLKNVAQIARIPVCHPQEFKKISSNIVIVYLMNMVYKLMLLSMDELITQSPKVNAEIQTYINKIVPVNIIPNGIEFMSCRNRCVQNTEKIRILYTGRISKEKGIETLLDSINYISSNFIDKIEIMLVGTGWHDYLTYVKEIMVKKHLERIVKIVGEVPHEEIFIYYKISDIYVFPSFSEGMPNSMLEAMGCELPIVASNIEANKNLIKDGYNGILYDVGDPRQLACALEKLLSDHKLRSIIGKNAYNSVKSKSWPIISEEYITAFQDVIKNRNTINNKILSLISNSIHKIFG